MLAHINKKYRDSDIWVAWRLIFGKAVLTLCLDDYDNVTGGGWSLCFCQQKSAVPPQPLNPPTQP